MAFEIVVCIFKRARSTEQKAERRTEILDAAARRFEYATFGEIKLSSIAADVGITKAALYRYFRNKEILFLALFERAFEQLSNEAEKIDRNRLAESMCDTLLGVPLYARLSAILSIILEHNLSAVEARTFKLFVLRQLEIMAQKLADKSSYDVEYSSVKLLQIQQVMIGSWHMCHRSDVINQVVKEPELRPLDLNFETSLRDLVAVVLQDA